MMKGVQFTVMIFGGYILFTGLMLVFLPSWLLLGLAIEAEVTIWMQLLGVALVALGLYYLKAAKDKNLDFIRGTVPVRIGQFFVVSGLVVLYHDPYILIAISALELLSGVWTWWHLRSIS